MASIAIHMIRTNHTSEFEKDLDKNESSIDHDSVPDSQVDSSNVKQYQTDLTSKNETGKDRENMDIAVECKEIDENKMDASDSSTNDVHNTNHSTQINNSNQQVTIDTIEYIHELSKIDLQQKEQDYSKMKTNQEEKIAKLKESIQQLEDGKDPLDLVHLNTSLTALELEWDRIIIRFEDVVNQTKQFLQSNRPAPATSSEQQISLEISSEQTAHFQALYTKIATDSDRIGHDERELKSLIKQCKEAIALKATLKAESNQLLITNNILEIIDERMQDILLEEEIEKEGQAEIERQRRKEIERLARVEAEKQKQRQEEEENLAKIEAIRKRREALESEKSAKKARLSVGKQ